MFKRNHFVVFLVSFAMLVFAYYCYAEKDGHAHEESVSKGLD